MEPKKIIAFGRHEKGRKVISAQIGPAIDFDHLSPAEWSQINAFLEEAFVLDDEQNKAVIGLIPMTQEIFDSIMRRREEEGPALEDMWMDVFLKFPDFAMAHTEKLEAELGLPSNEEEYPETDPAEKELAWGRLKKLIKEKYGDEL